MSFDRRRCGRERRWRERERKAGGSRKWKRKTGGRWEHKGFPLQLPDRLKDELTRIGKAEMLIPLQHQVQVLDQRYWERQAEISHDKRAFSNTALA